MEQKVKIGLQLHAVREAFAEDPIATLQRVREMGYTGVEIPRGAITNANEGLTAAGAEFYRKAIENAGLECYGILTSWRDVQPDRLQETIDYNLALNSPFLVIGSVSTKLLPDLEAVKRSVEYMCQVQKQINRCGIITGYHNHDSDFFHVIDDKTYFEHVFDNTPSDFVMLLDTGNAQAGGGDSIALLNKYPNRSPFLHIKGYSKAQGYLAWIGQDDLDWPAVCDCAIRTGGAAVFDVEFGQRGNYDPFERAQAAYNVISAILRDRG